MSTLRSGFAHSEVRVHHGVPTLFVNDQPLHGMTATSCAFNDPAVVKSFVDSGTEIMMIWIEVALHCWLGEDKYDWSYAEKKLAFFEEHSADTHWIIRVRLGLIHDWYRHAYPGEVMTAPTPGDGKKMSAANIASSVWYGQICKVVADFTKWLKTTRWAPRIIGFMLNAGSTEEWLIFDTDKTYQGQYHSVYTRELRSWLRGRYEDDEKKLQAAWNDPAVTFETAKPVSGMARSGSHIWGPYTLRDPAIERQAIDYYKFLNETLASYLIGICKSAKEAAGTPIVCGGFHSYLWWESGVYSYTQEYGHGLIQKLNESPWIDFISDITSYDNRYPGGPSGYLGLPHSINLHGKLHYTEVDLKTTPRLEQKWLDSWKAADPTTMSLRSAEPAIPDRIWKWNAGYCGRDEQEQIALFQREHMHNLVTGTPYWWFDIAKYNFSPPAFVGAIKKLSDIGRQAVNWDRRSNSQVAFVCSEDTPMYQSAMSGSLLRFEMESAHTLLIDLCARGWGSAGVPFDTYELHDLAHPDFPGAQYKMIVFVNCGYVSAKAAAGVRRWQKDGRVMCWTFAAAVLDDQQIAPALGESLIGMRLNWKKQRRNIHVLVDETGHPLTKGGSALNFGTEGAVGPVFFVDDAKATTLGHLRDGGEPGFAVRDHGGWKSVYLSMLNFGPGMMRNLAQFAGVHVWCATDDVIYANQSLLCLHTATAGRKTITLPGDAIVTDLWDGTVSPEPLREVAVESAPYRTRMWRTEYTSAGRK